MSDKLVQLAQQEHNDPAAAKKVVPRGQDGVGNFVNIKFDSDGRTIIASEEATTPGNTSVTVGTGSTLILAANADRVWAIITNDSNADIYLGLGAAAVLNAGVPIRRRGGALVIELGEFKGAINGISSAAGKNVAVAEGVE